MLCVTILCDIFKIGIYLMHNGVCVAENSFLQARELQFEESGLHCLVASSGNALTGAQVKWLYPDGNHVNCSKEVNIWNDIGCSSATNNHSSILYTSRFVNGWPLQYNGVYTCYLPGNCCDGSGHSITVRIFGQSSVL